MVLLSFSGQWRRLCRGSTQNGAWSGWTTHYLGIHAQAKMDESLEQALERLQRCDLYVAAHKSRSFVPSVKRCGRVYSREGVIHDPECVQRLVEMRRPEAVGESIKVLQAVNTISRHLPLFTRTKAPLQALMAEPLVGGERVGPGAP